MSILIAIVTVTCLALIGGLLGYTWAWLLVGGGLGAACAYLLYSGLRE